MLWLRCLIVAALTMTGAFAQNGAAPGMHGGRPETKVPFGAIKHWSTLRIRLDRSGCYGTCPIYSVEIAGDGTVNYLGERFVAVTGGRTAHIDRKVVRALYRAFARADFFWTFDEYRGPVTDFPTFEVTLCFDGRSKRVVDYAGKSIGMPNEIAELEHAIDAAAGTEKWIKPGKP